MDVNSRHGDQSVSAKSNYQLKNSRLVCTQGASLACPGGNLSADLLRLACMFWQGSVPNKSG